MVSLENKYELLLFRNLVTGKAFESPGTDLKGHSFCAQS